jgi:precorrin-6A/cobalt-precorrin-6A reductase
VGSLEGESAVTGVLTAAERAGDPFTWVIDATHPFATRISATLARACGHRGQPLVRLLRPLLRPGAHTTVLEGLPDLSRHCREDEPLLLAIGARHLGEAVRQSPGARHHCRILPTAGALRQAMAAGLAPQRVACLRPAQEATIERALCERWGIRTVVCRQSGGWNEGHWHEISAALGLRLLLLRRPPEPTGVAGLPLEVLTARVGWPEEPP